MDFCGQAPLKEDGHETLYSGRLHSDRRHDYDCNHPAFHPLARLQVTYTMSMWCTPDGTMFRLLGSRLAWFV